MKLIFCFMDPIPETTHKAKNKFYFLKFSEIFWKNFPEKIFLCIYHFENYIYVGCHWNFIAKIFFHVFQIQENSLFFKFFHVGILANFFMLSICNRILINWLNKKSQKNITLEKFWEAKRQTKKIFYQRKPL